MNYLHKKRRKYLGRIFLVLLYYGIRELILCSKEYFKRLYLYFYLLNINLLLFLLYLHF